MRLNEVYQSGSDVCLDNLDGRIVPWVSFNYRNFLRQKLNELNYKEIGQLIDPNFLKQGVRAAELKIIQLNSITPFQGDTMIVDVVGSKYGKENYNIYYNRFKFMQWDQMVEDTDLTPVEAARLLIWSGDIKLHCTCPSFLYWGYQYLLTVMDASIYPENRPPNIRNPRQTGIVCKHLNRSLKVYPFFSGDIAREIRRRREDRL